MRLKQTLYPYLLISPVIVIMLGLVFYPAALTLFDSFTNLNLMRPKQTEFVGFSNYTRLFHDPTILRTLWNTFLYFVLATIGEVVGGLLIALVLKKKFIGRGLMLAAVVIPWALPPVVNGVIWKWIYEPSYGVLNDILQKLHVISSNYVWLGEPRLSLYFVVIVHIWKMIPLVAVILLATLQTIPNELYEAGTMDGASKFQRFRHITLPLLKPALAIALTQGSFAAINLFDEVFVLMGSALDTRSILIQNYLVAFRELDLGLGMAISLFITLVTLIICLFYILWLNEKEGK